MIGRFHVRAKGVELLAVPALLQVRQLMHDDHPEECGRRLSEQTGDADLALGLQVAALGARNSRVRARLLDARRCSSSQVMSLTQPMRRLPQGRQLGLGDDF